MTFHVRDQEVDQTVSKDQGHQPGTASTRECQLPRGETEDNEIKDHSVNEGGGKDLAIGINNRACTLGPHCLQQYPYKYQI